MKRELPEDDEKPNGNNRTQQAFYVVTLTYKDKYFDDKVYLSMFDNYQAACDEAFRIKVTHVAMHFMMVDDCDLTVAVPFCIRNILTLYKEEDDATEEKEKEYIARLVAELTKYDKVLDIFDVVIDYAIVHMYRPLLGKPTEIIMRVPDKATF